MKLSDFDYSYPDHLVAHYPAPKRDESRLMVLDKTSGSLTHKVFKDIPHYFKESDVLVLNNTQVTPCRLLTQLPTGGKVECLLVKGLGEGAWECLLSKSARIPKGTEFQFGEGLSGIVLDEPGSQVRTLQLFHQQPLDDLLHQLGHVPLPPYIRRADEKKLDSERYQTIFSQEKGSVAAPTAGLHFTPEILLTLKHSGVKIEYITLHVGLGTFLPIRVESIQEHTMHGEFFHIPPKTADTLNKALREHRRITAVGTTVVRALESACDEKGVMKAGEGYTEKFIFAPYTFRTFHRLITNFHQPKSTLLVLVSAFAGYEFIMNAYNEAIAQQYRLFSYGDCLLIE